MSNSSFTARLPIGDGNTALLRVYSSSAASYTLDGVNWVPFTAGNTGGSGAEVSVDNLTIRKDVSGTLYAVQELPATGSNGQVLTYSNSSCVWRDPGSITYGDGLVSSNSIVRVNTGSSSGQIPKLGNDGKLPMNRLNIETDGSTIIVSSGSLTAPDITELKSKVSSISSSYVKKSELSSSVASYGYVTSAYVETRVSGLVTTTQLNTSINEVKQSLSSKVDVTSLTSYLKKSEAETSYVKASSFYASYISIDDVGEFYTNDNVEDALYENGSKLVSLTSAGVGISNSFNMFSSSFGSMTELITSLTSKVNTLEQSINGLEQTLSSI